jgi:TonB-dependent receptor
MQKQFVATFVAAMVSSIAIAQQPTEALEEVVVTSTPIRDSIEASIERQRRAENVVNVVASDAIGRFPDQTAAAALSRLPAVAVQRDQGQERYIQVRGAPNRWTSVAVDGITVIGADEGGNERAFRFDAVPAVILSAIEVNKSLTPDLSAEAIVASVNLATYSPFAQQGFAMQGDIGYGSMDLGDGPQLQGALRGSWSGERWGFVAGASHYRREQTTDNREFSYRPDGAPAVIDIRNYLVERETNGASVGLEFRPSDAHRLFISGVFSEFNDDEQRNQYVFQVGSALGGTRTASGGDLVGVPVRGTKNLGFYRTNNAIAQLGGDHELDSWKLGWRLGFVETENTTDLPIVLQNQTSALVRPSVVYDLRDPSLPTLTLYPTLAGATPGTFTRGTTPVAALDQSAFGLSLLLPLKSAVFADSTTAKFDLSRELSFAGRDWNIAGGLQLDARDIEGNLLTSAVPTVNLTSALPMVGLSYSPGSYVTAEPWVTGFPRGFGLSYVDNTRMRADLDAGLAALATAGLFNPAGLIVPSSRYTISEDITSGYARARAQFGDWQLVFGARIERVDLTVDGFLQPSATVTLPSRVEKSYTDVYPSVNFKGDLTDELVLRGALLTGIARPSFGVIRSGASISDVGRTITGGNPEIEPERTVGLDLSLEWYFDDGGLLSLGGFHRAVEDVLFDSTSVVADDRFNAGGVDRRGYNYVTTLNGRDGKLTGIELGYMKQWANLPAPFDGLGFQGNLAFLDGEFTTPANTTAAFPGTSDQIVNASLFYEKYGWSARVSYQWRDDWAETISITGLSDEFRKDYENIDVSLRYQWNDALTLYVDANNLTDETYIVYQGTPQFPTEVEQIGRRYMVGFRVQL